MKIKNYTTNNKKAWRVHFNSIGMLTIGEKLKPIR